MTIFRHWGALIASMGLSLTTMAPALAHHGWAWTAAETSQIQGKIVSVSLTNPHATLDIDVGGVVWHVDLAPLVATLNAGFVDGVVKPGDHVVAFGNRSANSSEARMKAVRVVVNGVTYDVYPARIGTVQ
jgi:hypothetical protein